LAPQIASLGKLRHGITHERVARLLPSSGPTERRWVALLCLAASLRVLVYSAAFPFFDNVDEQHHYDLVVRYSHAQIPRKLEGFTSESARSIARYGSPEYIHAPSDYPGGAYPAPSWTLPASVQTQRALRWESTINFEAHAPPLYYGVAGTWLQLGKALALPEVARLYWIRLLNVPLIAAVVWLAFATACAVFPANRSTRLAVPTLVAFIPQDTFYSIQSDVLSPLCFGAAFLGLLRLARADAPSKQSGGATGLAAACAGLVKTSNLPLVALWGIALLLDAQRRLRAGTLRAAAPALGWAVALAALPIIAWLAWNAIALGDFTGAASKAAVLGWTPKPLREWWPHPLFTASGARLFWTELTVSFWRGEFVWHRQPLAVPAADAFYAVSSAMFPGLALLCLLRAGTVREAQRRALWLAFWSLLVSVAFLALLSIRFAFGETFYPSRQHPYLTSGRLLSGALIPFALLYAFGLERAFAWTRREWPRIAALAAVVALITLSEAIANRAVFASEYNGFSLLAGSLRR